MRGSITTDWSKGRCRGRALILRTPARAFWYEGGFPRGKAQLIPAAPASQQQTDAQSMYLIPGILKFHSGSFSEWSPSLMEVCPEGFVEMNFRDLKGLGLKDGDEVRITGYDGASIRL